MSMLGMMHCISFIVENIKQKPGTLDTQRQPLRKRPRSAPGLESSKILKYIKL